MSNKSSIVADSDSSMFTANNDSLPATDSSFDISSNLTDITSDKTYLIDLTAHQRLDMSRGDETDLSHPMGQEDMLFGKINSIYRNTPTKTGDFTISMESETDSLLNKERGVDEIRIDEACGKRKRSDSDDSMMMIVTEESIHSGDQSDLDTSIEGESDSLKGPKNVMSPSGLNMKVANIDDNLPSTVTLLKTPEGAKVYIVGTAHFSEESQDDVSKIIQSVQPHIVMVELCSQRRNILQLDEKTILEEAKNIDFQKIRATIHQNGLFNGLIYILLLNMSAHITKELGMAPGGEFRRALKEVQKVPHCIVHLGDRPIQITMQRALSAISWWQTIRLVWHLVNTKDPISKEEVERCKQRDLLREMLAEMAGEFPALEQVFVQERDIYLTHSLQIAAASKAMNEPMRVVGVVGIGHIEGILQNWGKVSSKQIPPILRIPPPSLSSRIIKATIKLGFVGLIIYTGYKVIPKKWLPN